jgi:hypothetical protein
VSKHSPLLFFLSYFNILNTLQICSDKTMKLNHKKRKHRPPARHDSHPLSSSPHRGPPTFLGHHDAFFQSETTGDKTNEPDPLNALYIQAHEADVKHSAGATTAAQSLEVVEYHPLPGGGVDVVPKIGSALIPWEGGASSATYPQLPSNDFLPNTRKDADSAVWVDRYVQPPSSFLVVVADIFGWIFFLAP